MISSIFPNRIETFLTEQITFLIFNVSFKIVYYENYIYMYVCVLVYIYITYLLRHKLNTEVSIVRHNVFHKISYLRVRNKQDPPRALCNQRIESTPDDKVVPIYSPIRRGYHTLGVLDKLHSTVIEQRLFQPSATQNCSEELCKSNQRRNGRS